MSLEKYKTLKTLNILLGLVFLFSSNVLEDSLLIGLFSTIVLLSLFFSIKQGRENITRETRKNLKVFFRIQKKLLKKCYFIYLTIIKIKFKYLKKISKKYFRIKYIKLMMYSHLKFKFFFFKLIFFKLYVVNLLFVLYYFINFILLTSF